MTLDTSSTTTGGLYKFSASTIKTLNDCLPSVKKSLLHFNVDYASGIQLFH